LATLITQYGSDGEKRQCDAKCYNAEHSECRCICGGRNHGKGLEKARENTKEMAKELLNHVNTEVAKEILAEINITEFWAKK
jgi:predicted RNase H-like HicB family nuclease